MALAFDQIKCTKCHGFREVGIACPECGTKARQTEVNGPVVKRRELVRSLRINLERSATSHSRPESITGLLSTGTSIIDGILRGFSLATEEGAPDALLKSFSLYKSWALEVDMLPRLRPLHRFHDLLVSIRKEVDLLIEACLQALESPEIGTAQQRSDDAQAAIDRATAAAEQIANLEERVRQFDLSSPRTLIRSALWPQFEGREGSAMEHLKRFERELAQRLNVANTRPIAADVQAFEFLTEESLDMKSFYTTLKAAFQLFNGSRTLGKVASSPSTFIGDYIEARRTIASKAWRAGKALEQALSTQLALEELIELINIIVDKPGAFSARALLLATGVKTSDYDSLKKSNGTTHIKRAQQEADLAPLVEYLNLPIRTANAHDGIRLVQDQVIAESKQFGTTVFPAERIADTALGALEQTAAILFALELALSEIGITIDHSNTQAAMGISPLDIMAIGIEMAFHQRAEAQQKGGILEIESEGPHKPHLMFTLAQSGLTYAPAARHVRVRHSDGTQTRVLEGPAEPLRSEPIEGDPTESLHLLEAANSLTFDDAPLLSETSRRAMCAKIMIATTSSALTDLGNFKVWGKVLARLDRIAVDAGDQDLNATLIGCRKWIRTGIMPPQLEEALVSWLHLPPPDLP